MARRVADALEAQHGWTIWSGADAVVCTIERLAALWYAVIRGELVELTDNKSVMTVAGALDICTAPGRAHAGCVVEPPRATRPRRLWSCVRFIAAALLLSCQQAAPQQSTPPRPSVGMAPTMDGPRVVFPDLGKQRFVVRYAQLAPGGPSFERTVSAYERGTICYQKTSTIALDVYFEPGTTTPVALGNDSECSLRLGDVRTLRCAPSSLWSGLLSDDVFPVQVHGFTWPADQAPDPERMSERRIVAALGLLKPAKNLPFKAHGLAQTTAPVDAQAPVLGVSFVLLEDDAPSYRADIGPPLQNVGRGQVREFLDKVRTRMSTSLHEPRLSVWIDADPRVEGSDNFTGWGGPDVASLSSWMRAVMDNRCDDSGIEAFVVTGAEPRSWESIHRRLRGEETTTTNTPHEDSGEHD